MDYGDWGNRVTDQHMICAAEVLAAVKREGRPDRRLPDPWLGGVRVGDPR